MTQQYLPDIGATGNFTLKAPYNTLIKPKVSYTCKAIRKISDLLADGLDPFNLVYEPLNVDKPTYIKDLKDDVCIISLQTGNGEWAHFPSNAIIKFPNMNGIVYRAIMLGVSLGALPDTMLLDALKTSISNLVYDTLGVTTEIKEIVISNPAIVPKVDHDLIEAARLSKVTVTMSDSSKLSKANQDLAIARAKVLELENFIKSKNLLGE